MAGTDVASAATALCCHGKRGACRFEGPRGGGCKWGAACFFCHVCTDRVTTYNRIQKVLSSRRQKTTESTEAGSKSKCSSSSSAPGALRPESSRRPSALSLLGVVGACPELLFEGLLGEALPAASLCALPCASPAAASLVGSSGSLLLWRTQLRRLNSTGGLNVAAALVESLSVAELRRATRALSDLKAKSRWPIENLADLLATVEATEGAKRCISDGAVFALTCRYSASGRIGHGGLPLIRREDPFEFGGFGEAPRNLQDAATGEDSDHAEHSGSGDEGEREDGHDDPPNAASSGEPTGRPSAYQNEASSDITAREDPPGPPPSPESPMTEAVVQGHADEGDLQENEPQTGGVWASQLAFPELDDDVIRAPNCEWHFRVAPVIVCTRGRRGEAVVVHRVLKPIIVGGASQATVRHEASLWSATPSVCDFEDLRLLEERPLSFGEAAALLAGRPLRVVAAVRCLQRFWDVSLA